MSSPWPHICQRVCLISEEWHVSRSQTGRDVRGEVRTKAHPGDLLQGTNANRLHLNVVRLSEAFESILETLQERRRSRTSTLVPKSATAPTWELLALKQKKRQSARLVIACRHIHL